MAEVEPLGDEVLIVSPSPSHGPQISPDTLAIQYREKKWSPIIEKYALQYKVSYASMLEVARCESGFKTEVVGQSGEIGIYQYIPSTFYGYAPRIFDEPDIWNPYQQIELTAYLFSIGRQIEWTCWRTLNDI